MINIPLLHSAIKAGVNNYLGAVEFGEGLFAKHGQEGRQRANKVKTLIDMFTDNDRLKILALADAIFMAENGPTLCDYIFDQLKIQDVMGNNTLENREYGLVSRSLIVSIIQKAIESETGEEESLIFRAKRAESLRNKNIILNPEMFNAYSLVKDNPSANEIKYSFTGCTLL